MYKKIFDPIQSKYINTMSAEGYKVINKYIKQLGGHEGPCAMNASGTACAKSKEWDRERCELHTTKTGNNVCRFTVAESSKRAMEKKNKKSQPISSEKPSVIDDEPWEPISPIESPQPAVSIPPVSTPISSHHPELPLDHPYHNVRIRHYESIDGSIIEERYIEGLPIETVVAKWDGRQLNKPANINLIKGYIYDLYYPYVGDRIRNYLDRIELEKKDGLDSKKDLLKVLKDSYKFINSDEFNVDELMGPDRGPSHYKNHPYGSEAKRQAWVGPHN
tara:strand:+ start:2127 stop:2954 length:828 start_codon:yes stop_codon:yes gene_type:complete